MNVLSMYALIGGYSQAGMEWTDELRQVLTENVDYACDYIRKHFDGVEEYNRSVREFDIVTLDRVRRMDITPDFSVWMEYARGQRLHPAIISYLSLRPQHFYTVVPDVDGARFVTARGWEDLSRLLTVYEQLSIPMDAGVVGEFLQHEDVGVLLLRVRKDAVRVDGLVDQGRLFLARKDERHVKL